MQSSNRAEAERLLGIAEKLLHSKDLNGSRDFAHLAQETEPLLDGSDQILAVVDVLLAREKLINNQPDWYAVLQLNGRQNDDELIKRQYRRLALLLHPDKNKFPYADEAFKHVTDAWAVVSNPQLKAAYDSKLFTFDKVFEKVDLPNHNQNQNQNQSQSQNRKAYNHVNNQIQTDEERKKEKQKGKETNIWTVCPYCYNLYEYPKMYEGCCLRCSNCKRAYQAVAIPEGSLPPAIPGKEAYYCCWSYFPMGFAMSNSETAKSLTIPNWMPPIVPTDAKAWPGVESLPDGSSVPLAKPGEGFANVTPPVAPAQPNVQKSATPVAQPRPVPMASPISTPTAGATVPRKRGRPRKNPLP